MRVPGSRMRSPALDGFGMRVPGSKMRVSGLRMRSPAREGVRDARAGPEDALGVEDACAGAQQRWGLTRRENPTPDLQGPIVHHGRLRAAGWIPTRPRRSRAFEEAC